MDTMSEVDPVHSCKSAGSKPQRLKNRSSSVPAREHRSLMSDLDLVSEGRFLELEEDKRVLAGEEGGSAGRGAGGVARTGVPARGFSGLDGTTTGLRGDGPGVLGWGMWS